MANYLLKLNEAIRVSAIINFTPRDLISDFFLNVNFNGMCQKTDLDIHRQCLSVCMIKELILILVPNPFFFLARFTLTMQQTKVFFNLSSKNN